MNGLDVNFGPVGKGIQRLDECPPKRGEIVFNGDRNRRECRSADHAVTFEFPEYSRQNLGRQSSDRFVQRIESHGAGIQQADDQYRPFVTDPIEDASKRAARKVGSEQELFKIVR